MEKQRETISSTVPWGKVAGFALVIAAAIYASQHPHSFFYYLVKFIITPVP
jgi:ABC-type uncharacterized transport system substrate-binding protein